MDEFLPSEVARLILGYLKEVKCMKSYNTFLEESPNLIEYYMLFKNGKIYSTNVDGKSLLEMLTSYRSLIRNSKDNSGHFSVEDTPLKLADAECEKLSDEKEIDQKDIADKTLNSELNQEAAQNFINNSKFENMESTSSEEIRNSNNDDSNESLNVLENDFNSSVVNFHNNQETSSDSQSFLNSDMNSQPSNTFESYLSNDKTVATGSVNKPNDLSSNVPANNNSDKDLQSSGILSVIPVDNQTSAVSPISNNILLNSSNNNSQEKIKITGVFTMDNQSINLDAHSSPQTGNNSVTVAPISSQPTSTAQMTNFSQMISQLVSQPPQVTTQTNALIELPHPSLPTIFMPTLNHDGTIQNNLYRFVINTPVFNHSPVSGISLPLQTSAIQNVTSPLIVTSTPTVPLLGNAENTTNVENSNATPENVKLDPCKNNSSKQNASRKKLRDINVKAKAKSTVCKRPYKKRLPKRKPLSLFMSSLKSGKATQNKTSVHSVTEFSCDPGRSSAFKVVEEIKDREHCKSPMLSLLMDKAKGLLDEKRGPPYVRIFDCTKKSIGNGPKLPKEENPDEKIPEKSENVENVQNHKSLKKVFKVKLQENYIRGEENASLKKDVENHHKIQVPDRNNDVTYEENSMCLKKSYHMHNQNKSETNDPIWMAPKTNFTLKTYGKMHRNEEKNNQNKRCAQYDESPRKSKRAIKKKIFFN